MNVDAFFGSRVLEILGWTLIHSVWQILLVASVLVVVLRLMWRASANVRYAISMTTLALCLLLPVLTFTKLMAGPHIFNSSRSLTGAVDEIVDDDGRVSRAAASASNLGETTGQSKTTGGFRSSQVVGDLVYGQLPFLTSVAWLLGLALYAFRFFGGFWHLHQVRTRGVSEPPSEWQQRFMRLSERLDVASPRLLLSVQISTPIATGLFRPLIIVPAGIFLQMDPRQLETILAHELVHIRRYDPLVNILQSIVEVLFFFHPAIWWMSERVRREREFAADAAVLEMFENSRVLYASALANLEEIRHSTKVPVAAAAANGGNLMQRIQRILQKNTEIRGAGSAWSAGLAFVLISAVLTAVFSFNTVAPVNAERKAGDRKLAVGFVSIPPVDRSENPPKDAVSTAKILVEVLKAHRVPAIGFVSGSQISDGQKQFPVRAEIVKMWRDEGFEIGIGGFKHIWFYNTPYDEYVANAEKNISVVQPILAEKNSSLRYYSYPFLNTGRSVEERDRFESWLKDRGLTSVKYTVDNNEWMYSYAYDMARNDNDVNTMKEIRTEFVNYMARMFDHYEAYSQEIFGRNIAQTMVLTPSRLVADSAHDLFGMLEKRGYSFVPMSEAMADEAYKTKESFIGESGISWFERWTMASGKSLRSEPKVDQHVQKIWEARKPKN